jgi:hypothetical protein
MADEKRNGNAGGEPQGFASRRAHAGDENPLSPSDLKQLNEILSTVKYGSVTLVIQNGKVVQIEKNEKIRLV